VQSAGELLPPCTYQAPSSGSWYETGKRRRAGQ
jgi:hypothetical protein